MGKRGKFVTLGAAAMLLLVGGLFAGGCRSKTEPAVTRIDEFDYKSVANNHLTLRDFVHYLGARGIPVTQVQRLRPDVVKAFEAAAITVDGQEFGVYRFNVNLGRQRELLAKYHDAGFVYVLAYPYPVFIAGSFLVIGVEKHPRKQAIVEALRSFK